MSVEVHTGLGIKKRGRGTLLAAVSKIIVLSGPSSAQLSTSPLAKESDTVASASAAVSDAAADPADSQELAMNKALFDFEEWEIIAGTEMVHDAVLTLVERNIGSLMRPRRAS
ncbi:hypothetical protein PF005_g24809 [Phytophthora fragariae]|uniref:Uncharacterized protein n=1 Tax=Phytophthora fragariae TaxID=53985 RepID=A0A6A3W643_9STRA|nr:hypothetical protein PF005_g24809 [Phytophthora fragariae]